MIRGCALLPVAEEMTSYCLSPWSPLHASISSFRQKKTLKPSLFLELNAIFFTLVLKSRI